MKGFEKKPGERIGGFGKGLVKGWAALVVLTDGLRC